ncbi:hypothetical protein POVCU2_0031790 [Plasmodium ovale curtisi]|uniref:Uncharacterized protein n=1 Tax=Plasmodium ovale curtisi TaxID=864141 RepID=A0A1A8W2W2_PLAOA|nr:hypothetical protein POVCU2_0031790 [Plasmodium ovale curtisi]SBS95165.1 hypothetical protein POVCU1_029220 [Plasmodium ovale curtisi]
MIDPSGHFLSRISLFTKTYWTIVFSCIFSLTEITFLKSVKDKSWKLVNDCGEGSSASSFLSSEIKRKNCEHFVFSNECGIVSFYLGIHEIESIFEQIGLL